MTDTWGALGQAFPSAATLTDIYTATNRGTVEVIVCNRGVDTSIRLSHAVAGAADSPAQYLLYNQGLVAGDTRVTARFVVASGDVLRGYSVSGNVAFNINGIEEE